MAVEESNEVAARTADSKDMMQQNKALDSLTDHVEDRQLNSMRVHEVRTPHPLPHDHIFLNVKLLSQLM